MRIVVTGAAGFLGYHLSRGLLDAGHTVHGIDNLIGGDEQNVFDLRESVKERVYGSRAYGGNGFYFHNVDCCNEIAIDELFDKIRPDVVYHAACYPHEGLSNVSPRKITESVTGATMSVMMASVNARVKKIVYLSSMARYGYQGKTLFTESMQPDPIDPYGWAKFAAEGQIKSLCRTYGMNYTILVPHNIVGTHQKYDDPFRNVVSIMINRVMQGKQPVVYGTGEQTRCFSWVGDLIAPMLKCMDSNTSDGKIYNIGPSKDEITINMLAALVCDYAKIPCNPIHLFRQIPEIKHANCSSALAQRELGVKFETTIYDALPYMFRFIKDRGTKEFNYHLPLEIKHPKVPTTWSERTMSL